MTETLSHVESVLADAIVDDREAGIYRANRRIFTDEEVFELEMKHIFEGNWVYLAHESQIPNPGDYLTLEVAGRPLIAYAIEAARNAVEPVPAAGRVPTATSRAEQSMRPPSATTRLSSVPWVTSTSLYVEERKVSVGNL